MLKHNAQRGYTILEATVAMTIIAAAVAFTVPNFINKANQILVDTTVGEIDYLINAAQTFAIDNSGWPDEVNNCAGALGALTSAGRIANIDANNPFGNTYTFSCTSNLFTITSTADNANLAGMIATNTPATAFAGNTTTTTVPVPSFLPALQNFLARDGSDGGMQANLDMNDNEIRDVDDIYLSSVNQWLSNMIMHSKGVVQSGAVITLPTCPNGSPDVLGSVVQITQNTNPAPIAGFRVYATPIGANRARLTARRLVNDAWVSPSAGEHYIQYMTTCS